MGITRRHLVFRFGALLTLYFVCGVVLSLGQTWWAVKFHESQWTQGWIRILAFPYFDQHANPSTTGRYLGESNTDGDSWVINGRRNKRHNLFQFHYEATSYRNGMERNLVPGIVPEWSRVPASPTKGEVLGRVFRLEQIGGWPFIAWRGDWSIDMRSVSAQTWNCFPDGPVFGSPAWRDLVVYPFEPVFPGVIYNGVIYGFSLFLLWTGIKIGFREVRERCRVQDLRCPKCGYNCIDLTVCPECGHELGPDHLAVLMRR